MPSKKVRKTRKNEELALVYLDQYIASNPYKINLFPKTPSKLHIVLINKEIKINKKLIMQSLAPYGKVR